MWRNKANLFTLILVISDIDEEKKDISNLQNFRNLLHNFEDKIREAKNSDSFNEQNIINYLDAISYGTNDKEKRLRRFNILKEYLLA